MWWALIKCFFGNDLRMIIEEKYQRDRIETRSPMEKI